MQIKIYLAGRVTGGDMHWRERFAAELLKRSTDCELVFLKTATELGLNENDPEFIFGHDMLMIREADAVIVNLTDDISVGASQEMLVAKYYRKPLLGFVYENGKFKKDLVEINAREYKSWIHPFVAVPCDYVVSDFDQLAGALQAAIKPGAVIKDLSVIDSAADYFLKNSKK